MTDDRKYIYVKGKKIYVPDELYKAYKNIGIEDMTLCHVDSVPENFLLYNNEIKLIDFEYSGMQDPVIDIATFGITAKYSMEEIIDLYRIYKSNDDLSDDEIDKMKIYTYAIGLCWSVWSLYMSDSPLHLKEYGDNMYDHALMVYDYD